MESTAGLLYFHTIITHFPDWYEKWDFRNASTESGEQFFATVKRLLLRY